MYGTEILRGLKFEEVSGATTGCLSEVLRCQVKRWRKRLTDRESVAGKIVGTGDAEGILDTMHNSRQRLVCALTVMALPVAID